LASWDTPKTSKPTRRWPTYLHITPLGISAHQRRIFTALSAPFVGVSDGRIYDPRSGYALDWWGTGKPEIYQVPGTEATDIWQVSFADGGAVCTPNGIHVVSEPKVGQLRVQLPPPCGNTQRRLRQERQCGRRPVLVENPDWASKKTGGKWLDCPLLMSVRAEPQRWLPPEVPTAAERQRKARANSAAHRLGASPSWEDDD
jgi:hypothetical protein